ncbi:type II toxin-antitoxin system Phd/YefM family antitoxin [Desulfoluna sp.]|uniref:type II toxin-antitoxin system Phd/YefM family antitoxin n=1 Tax=Desulfoluna sp. TaxID=2045199 RepID=UPI00263669C0|nr:type II toxin-antitoxin system Phd/YefM family antitoxin [Desulfoluna sp.]
MSIKITEDIKSITELKRNTGELLKQIHKTRRPVVLTVNGKAEAVLMDPESCERMAESFGVMEKVMKAEQQVAAGETRKAAEFFENFKREHHL